MPRLPVTFAPSLCGALLGISELLILQLITILLLAIALLLG